MAKRDKSGAPGSSGTRRLKVFRTPIGFHDAYVAAPSQKAALEAWGSDANLFASGAAEQVTDPALMNEPLERPGEVIKRLRGSEAEQVAALDRASGGKKKAGPSQPSSAGARGRKEKPPKPSRAELDKAEERLEELDKEQRAERQEIDAEIERLERRRRDLLRRHERARDELADERDRARTAYERAVRRWR